MARYDQEFDETYGLGYGPRRYESGTRFGRARGGRYGFQRGGYGGRREGYEREYMGRERTRFSAERPRYGREYVGYGGYGAEFGARGYGREFEQSRWETDYGDPFHDRERTMPSRMTRGAYAPYEEEYREAPRRGERGYRGGEREYMETGYEVEYRPRRRRWRY